MSDLLADLEDYALDDDAMPRPDDEPEAPVDRAQADRMLWRLRRLARERSEVEAVADAEVARIRAWQTDRTAGIDRSVAWLERSLEGFARATGASTVNLPNGVLRLRPPRPRVEVVDEAAFLAWAREGHKELVRTTEAPDKRALGDLRQGPRRAGAGGVSLLTPEGEEVLGVTLLVPGGKVFKAAPSGAGGETG